MVFNGEMELSDVAGSTEREHSVHEKYKVFVAHVLDVETEDL
jgi:hypothetical protein